MEQPCPGINFYCRATAEMEVVRLAPVEEEVAVGGGGRGRGRVDWPNGIGEPDRRRLADATAAPLERCPLAHRSVVPLFSRRAVAVFSFVPHQKRERFSLLINNSARLL